MYGPASGTWPVIVTASASPRRLDQRRQRAGVLGGEAVGVAADDHRVHAVPALAQQRLGAEQPVLALPRLQAPDQTRRRASRRQLQGRTRGAGDARVSDVSANDTCVSDGCTGGDDERGPRGQQPRLRSGGGIRVAADRPTRAARSRSDRSSHPSGSPAATRGRGRPCPRAWPPARRTAASWPPS